MKTLIIAALFAPLAIAQYTGLNTWTIAPPSSSSTYQGYLISAASNITIQSASQKIAFKFYASNTRALTGADVNLKLTGSGTGITLRFDVESDSSDAPSGTVLGAATTAFAGPASSGFTGYQTFGSNTGTLTLNAPYWLVISDGGGTAPTSSNYYQLQYSTYQESGGKLRAYNGTNWTTVTAIAGTTIAVLGDGTNYYGAPTLVAGGSSTTKIYSSNREGVRWKMGAASTIAGVKVKINVNAPPNKLDVCLMTGGAGGAVIDYVAIPPGNMTTSTTYTFMFPTTHSLTAGAVYYLIAHQDANGGGNVCQDAGGGSLSNYYTLLVNTWNTTYVQAAMTTNFTGVSGTATDPESLSATANSPILMPIFIDPYTSLGTGSSSVTVAY